MYIPKYRTGAWALIMALYVEPTIGLPDGTTLTLGKNELKAKAQPLSDNSFDVSFFSYNDSITQLAMILLHVITSVL